MDWKCTEIQTGKIVVLPEDKAFDLDKRVWRITPVCERKRTFIIVRDMGRDAYGYESWLPLNWGNFVEIEDWTQLVGVMPEQIATPVSNERITLHYMVSASC